MKKRGFTLIELLAVIIILAIIALIATPIIMRVIENSKKGASKASIQNYLHAIETQVVAYRIDNEKVNDGTYSINNDGDVCINSDCTKKLVISMNGKKPSSGMVTIENGEVISAMNLYINPKYYIYADDYADDEIQEFEIGGYDSNNQLVADWDTLIKEGYITLSNDKKTITGSNKDKMASIGIATLVIKDGITSMSYNAFGGNTNLTTVIIPNSVTTIGQSAFMGCTNLSSIAIPNSVTKIDAWAFSKAGLTAVIIPNSVTYIGGYAFSDTNLGSVTIPTSIESLSPGVFARCNKLESITIPSNIVSIGESAFANCQNLTSVTIMDGLTSIGGYAFMGCPKLSQINIPNGVTSIERYAFLSCKSLSSIAIPDSVTSIGESAFAHAENLTSAKFENPNGWTAGDTSLSSSDLSNVGTAATYLKSTYYKSAWQRMQ